MTVAGYCLFEVHILPWTTLFFCCLCSEPWSSLQILPSDCNMWFSGGDVGVSD